MSFRFKMQQVLGAVALLCIVCCLVHHELQRIRGELAIEQDVEHSISQMGGLCYWTNDDYGWFINTLAGTRSRGRIFGVVVSGVSDDPTRYERRLARVLSPLKSLRFIELSIPCVRGAEQVDADLLNTEVNALIRFRTS